MYKISFAFIVSAHKQKADIYPVIINKPKSV